MSRHAYPIGAFEIESFPSQCQIAICHGFFVFEDRRGEGNGHLLKQEQMAVLRRAGYDYALCTVTGLNDRQKVILAKAGWDFHTAFPNRRIGGTTELWGTHL